ncbi:MAG: His-Xaa-Ser system protein HxsD [Elusimicrobiota bacterium]|jgi:His-Xaa-Ser system protein HxsD
MPPTSRPEGVVTDIGDKVFRFFIDPSLYLEQVVFKTCYVFIDRCYIHLAHDERGQILVTIQLKDVNHRDSDVAGEFLNELINQRLRRDINSEVGVVRQLLVAAAFDEGNLGDNSSQEADYLKDPVGINATKTSTQPE